MSAAEGGADGKAQGILASGDRPVGEGWDRGENMGLLEASVSFVVLLYVGLPLVSAVKCCCSD